MPKNRLIYLAFSLLLLQFSGSAIGSPFSAAGKRGGDNGRRLEQASLLYLEGVKRQNLGTLREAARMYEAALRKVPEHAAAYYRLSGIARMINDMQTALRYARRAYEIDTACRDYADNYARMLTVTGDYRAADSLFTVLLERDPSDIGTVSLLAVLKLEEGRPAEALALADTAEVRGGIRPQIVDVKRQALIRTERYAEAFAYMSEVCAQMPGEVSFRIQLAELAAALRRDSVALANYRAAIDLDSTGLAPKMALAEYYRIKEMWPEFPEALVPVFAHSDFPAKAKAEYFDTYVQTYPDVYRRYFVYMVRLADAALRAAPDDPAAREFYAKHLIYSGQLDLAHRYLTDCIADGEAPLKFYRDVIEMAQFRELPDTVAKYIGLAQERFPRDPELGMTVLFTQLQAGDTLAAVATAKEVIRYSENDSITASAYGFCGDMAHLRGDERAALRYYERALRLTPDNPLILNNFAYYLSEQQRDLERALKMSARANELDPQNATYLDTQAWVLYRLGRYEEAQTLMRQALVLDATGSAELLLHYGDILYALGKTFMAKTYWQRALEAGADGAVIEERLRLLNE